ncbi:hypothetical protein EMCRGX_G008299 [Ephydatia muelleri]
MTTTRICLIAASQDVVTANGQNCSNGSTTDLQNNVNILYTSLFFVSLLVSLPTFLLTSYQYCKKAATSFEYSEGIFVIIPSALLLVSFVESFQWVFQFTGHDTDQTACQLLAVCREYVFVTLIFTTACTGVQLCLLVRQPKWLMVIDELKRKRHRSILMMYAMVTFVLPLVFLPWPLMSHGYGRNDYICYIITYQPHNQALIEQLLLWYGWAYLVWFFTVLVMLLVLRTVRCNNVKNLSPNSVTLLSIMVVFFLGILMNTAGFVMDAALTPIHVYCEYPWLIYSEAICTPLPTIATSLILLLRIYKKSQLTARRKTKRHISCHENERSRLVHD